MNITYLLIISTSIGSGFFILNEICVFYLILSIYRIIRKNMYPEEQAKYDAWHDEAENWTPYGFYHNRGDKRLFPPTRHFNYGLTINFSNPISVIAQVGLIIIFILAPILIC